MSKNIRFKNFIQSWQEVEFKDFFEVIPTKTKVKSDQYLEFGRYPIVDQGKGYISGYCDIEKAINDGPYILFGDHTRCVKWVDFDFVAGADGVKLFKGKEGVDDKFAFYALQNTSIENLGYSRHMRELKNKSFIFPSDLDEQQKIADCLSTWDEAIALVEQQIALATKKKKALMQKLLTGKERLPGFEGEWRNESLGKLGVISSAGVDKKTNENEPEVRLLNYMDVYRNEFIYGDLDHVVSAPESKVKSCDIRKGDVFFTPSSETRDETGIAAVAMHDMNNSVYSYHLVRFRVNEVFELRYLAYCFSTDVFREQTYRLCDGSGQRYVLSKKAFNTLMIMIPSLDEQKAIGDVIFQCSCEIKNLMEKHVILQGQKKSLMQKLLG